jgi:hypothetical protein
MSIDEDDVLAAINQMGQSLIDNYVEEAIELGYLTQDKHKQVMVSLNNKALDAYQLQVQKHLDGHYKFGTECTSLPEYCEMFYVTTGLDGKHVVGKVREEFRDKVNNAVK